MIVKLNETYTSRDKVSLRINNLNSYLLSLLFLAMIDSLGGADKANNLLSTLNIKPINLRNLKVHFHSVYLKCKL